MEFETCDVQKRQKIHGQLTLCTSPERAAIQAGVALPRVAENNRVSPQQNDERLPVDLLRRMHDDMTKILAGIPARAASVHQKGRGTGTR